MEGGNTAKKPQAGAEDASSADLELKLIEGAAVAEEVESGRAGRLLSFHHGELAARCARTIGFRLVTSSRAMTGWCGSRKMRGSGRQE